MSVKAEIEVADEAEARALKLALSEPKLLSLTMVFGLILMIPESKREDVMKVLIDKIKAGKI